jgi:two-component system copper resistance phosphate regulon response regulator CusR
MRILIVEDGKKMAAVLKKGLEAENHRVTLAFDGRTGLELGSTDFDVIVLDLMLPVIDGFEVARRLRKNRNQTPILMLTARDAVPDIVKGLDLGADDYLTKPFSFEVFLARLRSVARRGSTPRPTVLQVDDLVLNPASHEVTRGERAIHLSPTEFRLLELLMRRSGRVVPRDAIAIVEAVLSSRSTASCANRASARTLVTHVSSRLLASLRNRSTPHGSGLLCSDHGSKLW